MPGATTQTVLLQNAATANGNGLAAELEGYDGLVLFEVVETAGGTATLTPQGSFDGTTWYTAGYQPIGAQATLTRSVTAISVTANLKQAYQLLDLYPQVRFAISAIAGAGSVNVKLYSAA